MTLAGAGWCQGPAVSSGNTPAAAGTPAVAEAPLLTIKRFIVEGDNPLSESETQSLLEKHLGPYNELTSIHIFAIKHFNGFFGFFVRRHLNKSESA